MPIEIKVKVKHLNEKLLLVKINKVIQIVRMNLLLCVNVNHVLPNNLKQVEMNLMDVLEVKLRRVVKLINRECCYECRKIIKFITSLSRL